MPILPWHRGDLARRGGLRLALPLLATLLASLPGLDPARAACADLALVLAIDSSGSIDPEEFRLQQLGYAQAFASPLVQAAIDAAGVVEIGAVFWGDAEMPPQILPLQPIRSAEDALDLGRRIAGLSRAVTGDTGIGSGISAAVDMLQSQAGCADRRIINISGDGRETLGARPRHFIPLVMSRERAETLGIAINALAIETDVPDLGDWYRDRVIAGQGAFVMRVAGFDTFAEALIAKLVREISLPHVAGLAAPAPPPPGSAAAGPSGHDG